MSLVLLYCALNAPTQLLGVGSQSVISYPLSLLARQQGVFAQTAAEFLGTSTPYSWSRYLPKMILLDYELKVW